MRHDKFKTHLPMPLLTFTQSITPYSREQRKPFYTPFFASRAFLITSCINVVVVVASIIIYIQQIDVAHNNSSRSQIALVFAVVSTIFFIISAGSYFFKKRIARKKVVGQLNAFLQWHICFGIIAVVTAAVHSFGHFQLVTGTLAFWSLVLLTLSGFIGRALDRILPRLITNEVTRTLTLQGEDVVTAVSQKVQHVVSQGRRPSLNVLQFLLHGDARAIQREQNYRRIIRYWRIVHITIFILTVVFICWHLLFAAEVMLGFGR